MIQTLQPHSAKSASLHDTSSQRAQQSCPLSNPRQEKSGFLQPRDTAEEVSGRSGVVRAVAGGAAAGARAGAAAAGGAVVTAGGPVTPAVTSGGPRPPASRGARAHRRPASNEHHQPCNSTCQNSESHKKLSDACSRPYKNKCFDFEKGEQLLCRGR